MKKLVKTILIIASTFLILLIGIIVFTDSSAPPTIPLIINNPLDLAQIQKISKFRSCVGHDFSGKNVAGQTETLRSMKHYIDYENSLNPNLIKIFAPFDGEISQLNNNGSAGQQVYISANSDSAWNFIFFHVELLPQFNKSGASIKAGQHIGNVSSGAIVNFDIAMKKFGLRRQAVDSPFNHMNAEVLAEYAAVAVTPEIIIIPKESRDADPCPTVPGSGPDAYFPSGDKPDDWVNLEKS